MTQLKTLKELAGWYQSGCIDWWKNWKEAKNENNGEYIPSDISDCDVHVEDLRKQAIQRCKMIKEIFLEDAPSITEEGVVRLKIDKSPARTPREAYFHQLGKFEELKRFCDITEEEIK